MIIMWLCSSLAPVAPSSIPGIPVLSGSFPFPVCSLLTADRRQDLAFCLNLFVVIVRLPFSFPLHVVAVKLLTFLMAGCRWIKTQRCRFKLHSYKCFLNVSAISGLIYLMIYLLEAAAKPVRKVKVQAVDQVLSSVIGRPVHPRGHSLGQHFLEFFEKRFLEIP